MIDVIGDDSLGFLDWHVPASVDDKNEAQK
jgi:hypothetical protein